MLMSLLTTTRLCPNCPDDSWGTTSIVAIPTPFWSDPNKVLTGQTPFARKFSEVNCENPLLYASEGGGSNQNGNRKAAGGVRPSFAGAGILARTVQPSAHNALLSPRRGRQTLPRL